MSGDRVRGERGEEEEGERGRECGLVEWYEGEEWKGGMVWGSEVGRMGERKEALVTSFQ